MTKEHRIMFRANDDLLEKIEKLSKKLKMGRSETLRLAVEEAIGKYIMPGYKGKFLVVHREQLDSLLMALHNRIDELESPKEQSYEEAVKAAKRVDKLRRQGKHGEADGIINDRAKKGLYTGYAYWPDAKEKKKKP